MTSNSDLGSISFDLPKNQSNVIKVIGVGGGGSNAINHMFRAGIKGVDFVVCNTDSQALQNSPVPNKIQLGVNLTEGLGAGANPEVGQQAALESIDDIEKMLEANTKMVFITAGMGGGTGTGAAPVIAQLSRERDILTVGIVTIPFQFEGKVRLDQAMAGVDRLRKQVDSLIVINNNKLREVYGNLGFKAGFSKADEVLATASRGIAEVITNHYTQNIDLKDAKTVLSCSGTAIMGSAAAIGENRAKEAIVAALDSPLLNDNKIAGAKNVLLLIVSGTSEITIDEIGEINDHIQVEAGHNANIIMGVGEDESLGDAVAVTIIATGFNVEQQHEIVNIEPNKIIHSLEDEQRVVRDLMQKIVQIGTVEAAAPAVIEEKIVFNLVEPEETLPQTTQAAVEVQLDNNEKVAMNEYIRNIDVTFEIVSPIRDLAFTITTPEVKNVVSEAEVKWQAEAASNFSFDLPLAPVAENEIVWNKENQAIADAIQVHEPLQVIPITELNENGVVRYSLEDYMELEQELLNSKPVAQKVEEKIAEELQFTMKTVDENKAVETPSTLQPQAEWTNPADMMSDHSQRLQAEERRRKLKDFNYKFHHQSHKVDDMEREPAYKRMGVDLTNPNSSGTQSRLSLGFDSNDDPQLRTNNSYLHDNVD
ncbi:MAG: cell division protein FtsZ [Flavobacterium sp. BFFFF2]|nr:MAG: cell division protein FtsZ [Flavobacterium sp. BFFFF2]